MFLCKHIHLTHITMIIISFQQIHCHNINKNIQEFTFAICDTLYNIPSNYIQICINRILIYIQITINFLLLYHNTIDHIQL